MKNLLTFAVGALISNQHGVVSAAKTTDSDDTLHFAFQVTRHGARAPGIDNYGFEVQENELTASGMRQRFLLGDHNRKRYIDQYGLLDSEYNPAQLKIETTLYDRTFQSGYSEMMGLYPPSSSGDQEKLNLNQVFSDRLTSTFQVREKTKLIGDLGRDPLPLGFVQVPIFSHIDTTNMRDDLDLAGCDYVNEVDGYRFPADSTYIDYQWLMDDLRVPISDMFNLTTQEENDMDAMTLYNYCDVIQSRLFEGVPLYYTFTDDEMTQCNQTVLATLVEPMQDPIDVREMYVSKQLRRAHDEMSAIVSGSESMYKYITYSTHDWTLAQHMLWINATNGNFTVLPFASHVAYELHSNSTTTTTSSETIIQENSGANYWVEVFYNGVSYEFEQCQESTKCSWQEWSHMMESVWIGSTTGYKDECAKQWTPPTEKKKSANIRL